MLVLLFAQPPNTASKKQSCTNERVLYIKPYFPSNSKNGTSYITYRVLHAKCAQGYTLYMFTQCSRRMINCFELSYRIYILCGCVFYLAVY